MKKVIFVANIGWTLYNFRLGLLKRLREEGFEVFFACGYDRCAQELIKEGFTYLPLRVERKGLNVAREFGLFWALWRIYRKHRFSVAFHYSIKPNIYGAIAAGFSGIPCVNTVAGLGSVFSRKSWLSRLVKASYAFAFRFPAKVFFQNKDDRDFFLEHRFVTPDKIVMVPGSGVDADRFDVEKFARRASDNFVFLFSGRLLWEKGVGDIIEAFRPVKRKHPATELWFLGFIDKGNPSGIPRDQVARWEQEGLLRYWGSVLDVRPVLSQCDAVIYPSYYREGIPRSLLEAMAMKKPVIAADSVGCRDVVTEGEGGFLVPPRDVEALAVAMEKLILMPARDREALGEKGRQKILREFDEKTVIVSYLNVARSLAKNA